MTEQRTQDYRVGSRERPDPAGIIRRGGAAELVTGYAEQFGKPPACLVGKGLDGVRCGRAAVMEAYGLFMCPEHGEEAASGVLDELFYDLEQELQRPMNSHLRSLSPHMEAALMHGFESLPEEDFAYRRSDDALLEAFPLKVSRVDAETLAYTEDPDASGRGRRSPPYDAYMSERILVCRHMRLAFEEGADWLVETLEPGRESIAEQAAYALALETEAGLR